MPLRGVIFDMGGTLLSYHPPDAAPQRGWEEMEALGAVALRTFLEERGFAVPSAEDARARNFAIMERYWRQMGRGEPVNPQLGVMLHEVMADWGVPADALQDGLITEAQAAYVAPVQAIVRPLEGAAETLAALRARGLRIGLFSNTVWPGTFHMADLAHWGLAEYLECALFSADVAAWKPAARVFEMSLQALDLRPEEAVYVGDHPYFDVYGAQQAGLRGVWIRSAEWALHQQLGIDIVPDATLERLPDLLTMVEPWLDD